MKSYLEVDIAKVTIKKYETALEIMLGKRTSVKFSIFFFTKSELLSRLLPYILFYLLCQVNCAIQ